MLEKIVLYCIKVFSCASGRYKFRRVAIQSGARIGEEIERLNVERNICSIKLKPKPYSSVIFFHLL